MRATDRNGYRRIRRGNRIKNHGANSEGKRPQRGAERLRDCVKSHLASLRSMILEAWARIIASLEEGLVS